MFTAQDVLQPQEILHHVPCKVTEEMNESLTRPFSANEVKKAIFMMGPNKAPRPDGLTAGFYQTHWDILGLTDDMNKTTIVFIPKVKNPQSLKQFRPISLCNVIYKTCSKVLANRMRCFLDEIISEEQSAFVPGRLITDNVLTAYECTHYLKRKKGKNGACAIKLDMAKACDQVEWIYLQGIMIKLGFDGGFVNRFKRCVTSASLSVKVNGKLSDSFRPTRRIRQGDSISPYLFLLCAEGLFLLRVQCI